mmetsp:Transcript_22096/g.37598  ORF Transcript_22096/g.37598 Transcript_22096/m.37598 type:complete len:759 (-) Transcript_22096:45-2321(-)
MVCAAALLRTLIVQSPCRERAKRAYQASQVYLLHFSQDTKTLFLNHYPSHRCQHTFFFLQEILLKRKFFFVGIQWLVILNLVLDLLGEGLLFLLGQLLLGSLELGDITSSICHFRYLFLLFNLGVLLQHPVGISLGLQVTSVHDPCLGAELLRKLIVVRDNDNSSLKRLNRTRQSSKRFTIQIVGRLVQHDNVRLVPHGSSQHNLHLLSSRQGRHTVVSSKLTVQPTILQMLFDVLGRQRTNVQTSTLSNLEIHSLHGLVPTHLLQSLGRQVFTRVHRGSSVPHFVLVILRLVGLTSSNKLRHNLLDLGDLSSLLIGKLDLEWGLLLLELLIGKLHSHLHQRLLVLSIVGISPSNVLVGGLVQVLLNVVKGVLGNVCNTGIGVLPHFSLLGLTLSNQQLDHGRFSGTILTDTGDTRRQGYLHTNVKQSWLLITRVGKGTAGKLHESFTLGLDTLDRTWLRELELLLGGRKGKVGTRRWVDLDVFVEVTLERAEFQVVNSKNVGAAVIEETRVVRHHDTSDVLERVQVGLHPCNVDDIQVVGRLIQKKNVSLLKHSTGKSELHTPSSTEGRHSVVGLGLTVVSETDRSQHTTNLVLLNLHGLNLLVGKHVFDAGKMGLFSLDISLDENGTDLVNVRESLNLISGDGSHECGLSRIVRSEQSVSVSALELHLGVVEQNLGSVGKGELAIAEFLGIVVVVVFLYQERQNYSIGNIGGTRTTRSCSIDPLPFQQQQQQDSSNLVGTTGCTHLCLVCNPKQYE